MVVIGDPSKLQDADQTELERLKAMAVSNLNLQTDDHCAKTLSAS